MLHHIADSLIHARKKVCTIVRPRTVINRDSIGKFLVEGGDKGTDAGCKPWLSVQDGPSQREVTWFKRWKIGKTHHLLSNLEREALFVFEWSSN
jgi:hypothetical protein